MTNETKIYKTPSYSRRATKNYKDKHDSLQLTAEKGTKNRIKALGLTNKDLLQVIYKYLEDKEARDNE